MSLAEPPIFEWFTAAGLYGAMIVQARATARAYTRRAAAESGDVDQIEQNDPFRDTGQRLDVAILVFDEQYIPASSGKA